MDTGEKFFEKFALFLLVDVNQQAPHLEWRGLKKGINKNYVHLNMMALATPLLEQTPQIQMYCKVIMCYTKTPKNVCLLHMKRV